MTVWKLALLKKSVFRKLKVRLVITSFVLTNSQTPSFSEEVTN